ncbi:hypothetical protein P171DRAFT_488838 [Karstenula rhodostoma CBS 690.94]|uniref:Uncharacterized protein n=1 Tax=Karstenula rhodostoma CBS 690.94 TaxID=1392251 RepID=A0A9P4PDX9_9PLEO|nr:hypothetical protein P171DRAFT_488838 [Karstenula rhodostoma CBS 690.94]
MSGERNANTDGHVEPDFAQAFKELARGEGAATAMENHLDALEKKIKEMLAKAEEDEKALDSRPKSSANDPSTSEEHKPAA